MSILEIGCCGAYCKTCIQNQQEKYPDEKSCRGCKVGYKTGERNIDRVKCKIKICCFKEKQIQKLEKKLGKTGRILVRPSGTEPVIRVMVEGRDEFLINNIADELCGLIYLPNSIVSSRVSKIKKPKRKISRQHKRPIN